VRFARDANASSVELFATSSGSISALRPVLRQVRLNQMSYRGLTLNERGNASLEFAIAERQALMLPKVLGPRGDEKRLKVHVGSLHVAKHAPSERTITAPDSLVRCHRMEEVVDVRRGHSIFDRD